MHAHISFAHPVRDSFTGKLLDALISGLDDAGHTHTVSDLYAMGFDPVMGVGQYRRESRLLADEPVPDDVAAEQAKLEAADAWIFLYTVWWSDCPAILKGWFDRVWTVGYAYDPGHNKPGAGEEPDHIVANQHVVEKALAVCTAGHSEDELRATGLFQAMEAVMLQDRIGTRAKDKQFVVIGGSSAREQQLDRAYHLGLELGQDRR